jgi:hypothetical protein
MVSIRVMSAPRPWAHWIRAGSALGVVVLERHGVDLDLQAGRQGRVDPGQHLGQVAAPGQLAEQLGLEGVERDVDPPHAQAGQVGGVSGQLGAVGGQGQLVQRAGSQMPRQPLDQGHDPLADQRLAAGQPQLAHAQAHEGRGQPIQFLQRQDLRLRQEGHVLGHAIGAAQVAAVGDRDAQIGHRAAEAVDQTTGQARGAGNRLRGAGVIGRHVCGQDRRGTAWRKVKARGSTP